MFKTPVRQITAALKKRMTGLFAICFLALLTLSTGAYAGPYGATQCAPSRFGSNLGCTANDVSINTITVANTPPPSCIGGQTLPIDLNVTVQFGSASRYNIGVFVSNDGKDPKLLAGSGGATSCSVAVLPTTSPFLNLDGNSCGDGNSSINGNAGNGTFLMSGVAIPCTTNGSGTTTLYIPFLVSWDQGAGTCVDNTYPVPGTTSKCNTGTVSFPPGTSIVVLPAISITDGVTTVRSGGGVTYTIVITNTTGSPLSGAVFNDPAIANLSVSSVSCSAAGGATCPAGPTVAAMQGAGITLPGMPINSTLTFTVTGTVANLAVPATLTNTASVTVLGQTNSASDTDTIMVAPTVVKSFNPGSVVSGGTSTLTITLTNPNAIAITGAAFADTYPSNMQNQTPTGAVTTCTGGIVTATAGGASLSLSGATIAANSSCTVSVNVWATASGTNNTGAVTSSNAASGASASATLSITASGFNAFETSTAANAITGRIYTKLAGTAFALDVVAISGASQATGFNGNVKVELLANTGTVGSGYDASNCPASNTVIQTIASTVISGGRSTVNFAAVAGAYRDVRVRISYPTSASTVVVCSNDSFSIRPPAFTTTSSDATNTGTSGAPMIKTGANFNLTATAVTGYVGTPILDATQVVGSSTAGTLSGVFGAANGSGVATGNAFTYSEVGRFGLNANAVYDSSFTSIDQPSDCTNDFSNVLVSGKFGCKIGSNAVAQVPNTSGFGRFIPDHFDTVVTGGMNCPIGLTCPTLFNGFVYSGQPFTTNIIARNLSGATTLNYDGALGFAKAVTLSAWDGLGSTTTQNPPAATPGPPAVTPGALTANAVAAAAFKNGATTTGTPAAPVYTLPNAFPGATPPPGPTDIYLRAVDTDAVTSLRGGSSVEGGIKIVSGRVLVPSAYGSELLGLSVNNVTVQYYNGTRWVTSSTDTTALAPGNVILANCQKNLGSPAPACKAAPTVAVASVSLVNGVGTITLKKPDAGNDGSVDVSLGAAGWPTWLPSTVGRAAFGVYKSRFIYLREIY